MRRWWRRRESRGQSGYATAETAVALPVLVVVLALALWGLSALAAQLACMDAARLAARAAARGESVSAVRAAAVAAAPQGARVGIAADGPTVRVEVAAEVASVPRLPAWPVRATAAAARESP